MTNTNCLENIRCPSCGNEDTFRIEVKTMATVTDDGTELDHGTVEWDENSYLECPKCFAHGKLGCFKVPPPEPQPTQADLLRFLTDFVAFGYDPSGRDHWYGMGLFLEHARRLLRQAKGRRSA